MWDLPGPYPDAIKDPLRHLRGKCGRLRFVCESDQRKPSRGRKPNATGLLIALDAICMHGIEWSGPGRTGTLRVVPFQEGRRWKTVTEIGMEAHVEEMLASLEQRWALCTDTIRDHAKRNQRYALKLLTDLLRLPWSPPVTLSEIQYAVAEQWSAPEFRSTAIPRLEPGTPFNLFPYRRQTP